MTVVKISKINTLLLIITVILSLYACGGDKTIISTQKIRSNQTLGSGNNHTCAIWDEGSVGCWGANKYGQLGNGDTEKRSFPVQVYQISSAIQLSSGDNHTCAVLKNGTVWCWGQGERGQLGNGEAINRSIPVKVKDISGALQVSSGLYHSCALLGNGNVWCWGNGDYGQIGNNNFETSLSPIQVYDISTAVQISTGDFKTCALLEDSTVSCWGVVNTGFYQSLIINPVKIAVPSSIKQLGLGNSHLCVLKFDGTVWCWGDGFAGQLGNGNFDKELAPTRVLGISSVVQISVERDYTCALISNGTVWCWGGDRFGKGLPDQVLNLSSGTQISRSCALSADGGISCWNYNGIRTGSIASLHIPPVTTLDVPLNTELESTPKVNSELGITPGGIANVLYQVSKNTEVYDVHYEFKVEHDPERNTHIFWAQTFGFENGHDNGGYIGMQYGGSINYGTIYYWTAPNKIVVFSIWNAEDAQTGDTGNCFSFDHEGVGFTCVAEFDWQVNIKYRLKLVLEENSERWVKAWIENVESGKNQYFGKIKISDDWGTFQPFNGGFTELFSELQDCNKIPYTNTIFYNPVANQGTLLSSNPAANTYGFCQNYANTTCDESSCNHETGVTK